MKTQKQIKLNTPCTSGWLQYPEIPAEFHIEFGKKLNFYFNKAKSLDETLLPDLCIIEHRLTYDLRGELAELVELD